MHPVHFGLILVYNLCIGNITPPVGNTLFVAIKVGGTTLAKTVSYMIWYYLAILTGLLLITYVPFLSTRLTNGSRIDLKRRGTYADDISLVWRGER